MLMNWIGFCVRVSLSFCSSEQRLKYKYKQPSNCLPTSSRTLKEEAFSITATDQVLIRDDPRTQNSLIFMEISAILVTNKNAFQYDAYRRYSCRIRGIRGVCLGACRPGGFAEGCLPKGVCPGGCLPKACLPGEGVSA